LLLLAYFNKSKNYITEALTVYGKVPLFYFLLHLFTISVSAHVWTYVQFGRFINFSFLPPDQWPKEYAPSMLRTYLVWIAIVVILYFPCKWYGKLKAEKKIWWMSYL
jgi:hypothetical protein